MNARRWRKAISPGVRDEIELGQILMGPRVMRWANQRPVSPRLSRPPTQLRRTVAHQLRYCISTTAVTDVERKARLGGNLHAKGMMIVPKRSLIAELDLDQRLPFLRLDRL